VNGRVRMIPFYCAIAPLYYFLLQKSPERKRDHTYADSESTDETSYERLLFAKEKGFCFSVQAALSRRRSTVLFPLSRSGNDLQQQFRSLSGCRRTERKKERETLKLNNKPSSPYDTY
jgi:hypothetical protein